MFNFKKQLTYINIKRAIKKYSTLKHIRATLTLFGTMQQIQYIKLTLSKMMPIDCNSLAQQEI